MKRSNAWVNLSIKKRICSLPCTICGRKDDIECDHIISIRLGGNSDETNLQPLCRTCNSIKGHLRSNDDVREWIDRNRDRFERSQQFRTYRLQAIARGER